jgi:hypothetical protein
MTTPPMTFNDHLPSNWCYAIHLPYPYILDMIEYPNVTGATNLVDIVKKCDSSRSNFSYI